MNYEPDPSRHWKRKNYDESLLARLPFRERCELEADRDLEKPLEQLVCDIHEETHGPHNMQDSIAFAQKRFASLMARIAKANDRMTAQMLYLTWAIAFMTLVILGATIAMLRKS